MPSQAYSRGGESDTPTVTFNTAALLNVPNMIIPKAMGTEYKAATE